MATNLINVLMNYAPIQIDVKVLDVKLINRERISLKESKF